MRPQHPDTITGLLLAAGAIALLVVIVVIARTHLPG